MLVLVYGGSGSGKSEIAEDYCLNLRKVPAVQAGGAVTRFKFPRFREYPFEGIHLQERSQGIEIGRFGAGGALGLFQRRNQVIVQLQDNLSRNEETICVRSLFRRCYGRNLFFYLLTGKNACQRE